MEMMWCVGVNECVMGLKIVHYVSWSLLPWQPCQIEATTGPEPNGCWQPQFDSLPLDGAPVCMRGRSTAEPLTPLQVAVYLVCCHMCRFVSFKYTHLPNMFCLEQTIFYYINIYIWIISVFCFLYTTLISSFDKHIQYMYIPWILYTVIRGSNFL